MFHVRHQFRFCTKQYSWITALKFLASSPQQQQPQIIDEDDRGKNQHNEVVIFNNLVRFGYERSNSHIIHSLQRLNNKNKFHLNAMGVRASLSILEKWESNVMNEQEKKNFAFWICRNLPLVLF